MPKRLNQSIAVQVIITIVSVVTVLLSIVGAFGYEFYSNQYWKELRENLELNADKLVAGVALAVWNFDNDQIEKIMESAMEEKAVYAINIRSGNRQYSKARDAEKFYRQKKDAIDSSDLIVAKRTILFGPETIGSLEIYMTSKFLQEKLARSMKVMIIAVVILDVILIMSLYLLIWLRVLRPLKLIDRFAQSISSGNNEEASEFTQPLDGEFGQLRNSLEKMIALLESRLSELKESNDRFWKLVTGFPVGFGLYSPVSGEISYVNHKFVEVFGYQPEEIRNIATWFELAYPDEALRKDMIAKWVTDIENAYASDNVIPIREYNVTTKDNKIKNVEIGGVSAGDTVLVIFNDITERKKAEEELRSYRDHLEDLVNERTSQLAESEGRLRMAQATAHLGNWSREATSGEVIWSEEVYKIYGLKPGEVSLSVELVANLVHPDDLPSFKEAQRNELYQPGGRISHDYRIIRKDGQVRWIHVEGMGEFDNEGHWTRVSGTVQDITPRKQNELELIQAREAADAANRAKSVFLANMSHELRTPLNSVIGFSKMMANDEYLSERQQRNLEIINRAGTHLLTLINGILELSKIDAGKVEIAAEVIDLRRLLQEVVEMLRPRADQTGLALVVETNNLPEAVITDASKLRQVLLNLVSNAVKFTEQGSVTVIVNSHNEGVKAVVDFKIVDTGVGIKPQDQKGIFEPFVQLDAKGQNSGTGLGLAISRQYVKILGGDLQLQSALGTGSTFKFRLKLPICKSMLNKKKTENKIVTGVLPEHREFQVLIADDVPEMRELLKEMLEPLGLQVYEADNGIQANEMISKLQPNLLLVDWRMPLMDGITLTKQIRSSTDIVQPCIVMLSANAFTEDRQQALAAGADDFLGKPFDVDLLYETIERHMGILFKREKHKTKNEGYELKEISSDELNSLSKKTIEEFTHALRELNPDKIRDAMKLVRAENDSVASRLDGYVQSIQYRQLWKMFGILNG